VILNQSLKKKVWYVKDQSHRFYYGWVIVAVSFFTIFLALGIRFSFGVFYVAILGEYGWGRGETAGAFSLAMVTHALFAPVTGTLIDRFGPRVFFPLGALFMGIGLVAASYTSTIWHLYLFFGVIIAVGVNTLSFTSHMSLIPKWFFRKKGLASGLVLSGIGVGSMVLAPSIQFIIDTAGWRYAFLILAGITLFILVPMTALFQRRSPEEVGQTLDDSAPSSSGPVTTQSEGHQKTMHFANLSNQWKISSIFNERAFWWIALTNVFMGFTTNMLVVHQTAHIVDVGYSKILAASLFGLVGLLGSIGGIMGGFLSDRIGRDIAYTMGSSAAFVGVVLFLCIRDTSSSWMLYAFVILYGLGCGSMGPAYAAIAGDLFPVNSLGRILGILTVGFGLGGALGAYIAGYLYDVIGNYTFAFLLVLVSICIGNFGILMAARRYRQGLSKVHGG
jgi:MFS family permease